MKKYLYLKNDILFKCGEHPDLLTVFFNASMTLQRQLQSTVHRLLSGLCVYKIVLPFVDRKLLSF
jgi:hypothetical protein